MERHNNVPEAVEWVRAEAAGPVTVLVKRTARPVAIKTVKLMFCDSACYDYRKWAICTVLRNRSYSETALLEA